MARRFVQRRQRDLHGLGTSSGMQVLQEKKLEAFSLSMSHTVYFAIPKITKQLRDC
jgi:hypothetical protein